PPRPPLLPSTTLFRSLPLNCGRGRGSPFRPALPPGRPRPIPLPPGWGNCGRTAGGGVRGVAAFAAARERGASVRGQAFGRREHGGGPGERGGGVGRELLHGEGPHEVEHGEAGERAGEAAGGEDVVGAG